MTFSTRLRRGFRPGRLSPPLQIATTIAAVVSVAAVLLPWVSVAGPVEYVLIYVLIVAITSFSFGLIPALIAAGASTAAIVVYYFAYWTDHLRTAPYVITTFIVVSGVICLQAARLQWRKRAAIENAEFAQFLADMAIELTNWNFSPALHSRITREISESTGTSGFAVFRYTEDLEMDGRYVGPEVKERYDEVMAEIAEAMEAWRETFTRGEADSSEEAADPLFYTLPDSSIVIPLCSFDRIEGVMYLGHRSDGRPFRDDDLRVVYSLTKLFATRYEAMRVSALTARRDAIKDSEELRRTLVSAVSHELKSPLTAMKAVVHDLSSNSCGDCPGREQVKLISDGIDRMQGSIGGLLDVTLMDLSQWRAAMEPVEIGDLLGTVMFGLTQEQRTRVLLDVPADLPFIWGDPRQLSRVIANVLLNALAYTPSDSPVTVGVAARKDHVVVWVVDRGPGIAAGEEDAIFERFHRGSASHAAPGTGLGLTVAREIARYHGGDLILADSRGNGARFELRLPMMEGVE